MSDKVWLKHYPADIPHTLEYEEIPVQTFLTRAYEKIQKKLQSILWEGNWIIRNCMNRH